MKIAFEWSDIWVWDWWYKNYCGHWVWPIGPLDIVIKFRGTCGC